MCVSMCMCMTCGGHVCVHGHMCMHGHECAWAWACVCIGMCVCAYEQVLVAEHTRRSEASL